MVRALARQARGCRFEAGRHRQARIAQRPEHQDDNLERHIRLVLRVPGSCGEKEIIPDYGSGWWGFESLREHYYKLG